MDKLFSFTGRGGGYEKEYQQVQLHIGLGQPPAAVEAAMPEVLA